MVGSQDDCFRQDDVRIAAIIPLYNGALYITQSMEKRMNQTLPPAEIIVVDDGSTDNGPEIVEKLAQEHPIKLLRKPNGVRLPARNFGIANSNCDLIALLDQDDVWYSHHLQMLIKPFLRPRIVELGWVYSNLDEIDLARPPDRPVGIAATGGHPASETRSSWLSQHGYVRSAIRVADVPARLRCGWRLR